MARRVLVAVGSFLRRLPRVLVLAGGATLLALGIAAIWYLARPAQPARCSTPCLCRYCDEPLVNGRCPTTLDGGCIGGAGNCTSGDNCEWSGQAGGCGPVKCGCRNRDCLPGDDGKPTPTPPPPTPAPKACQAPWDEVKKPSLAGVDYRPSHPVVVGQDPDPIGFTIPLTARGGVAIRHTYRQVRLCQPGPGKYPDDCPAGPWYWDCEEKQERFDDPLVKIDITMDLDPASSAWINGYLNGRYTGAHAQEDLPARWKFWEGVSMSFTEEWHYMPKDPGAHQGEIILFTRGTPISPAQEVHVPYRVPVWLIDTTIGE